MVCPCTVALLLVLYILVDVNYFIHFFVTCGLSRFVEKKKKLTDQTTIYGLCTTQDIDIVFKHMNNARYLRDLDFARFHYYERTGLYSELMKKGAGAVLGASTTRYRRSLPLFTPYKITTKLIYWEDKHVYLEHQFISLTDNFVRAVALSKQTATNLNVPINELIEKLEPNIKRPEMDKDLELWMQSMQESSQKLRKQD